MDTFYQLSVSFAFHVLQVQVSLLTISALSYGSPSVSCGCPPVLRHSHAVGYAFLLTVESTVIAGCCQLLAGVLVARMQVRCRLAQLRLLNSCTGSWCSSSTCHSTQMVSVDFEDHMD